MSHKTINWSSFAFGKEYDAKNLDQHLNALGLKFVVTSNSIRFLVRYVFLGKKISKGLGSCSYDKLDDKLVEIQHQLDIYQKRMNKKQHPFEEELIPEEVTFAMFSTNTYLVDARSRKKSHGDDESRLRMHLIPALGFLPIASITAGQLNQLLSDLHHHKNLSNATINRVRALLSAIFNMAINHEILDRNPMQRVKKYKENNQKERYLNEIELKSLMQVLQHPSRFSIDNLVIVAIVKFLLLTGVRKREALDMQWSDIDLQTGVWLLGENKSGKARRIHLNSAAISIIQQMSKRSSFIFANPKTGSPFNDIRKSYDKIMDAANISNMRIHDLRHNFASLAVNSGQSLYVVQHLLGHASPQTTQRYAHLRSETLLAASEQIAIVIKEAQIA